MSQDWLKLSVPVFGNGSGIMAYRVFVLVAVTGLLRVESWWAPVSHFSGSNITYPADYAPNGTAPGDPGPQKLDPGVSANRTWWKFWRLDQFKYHIFYFITRDVILPPSRELVFLGLPPPCLGR